MCLSLTSPPPSTSPAGNGGSLALGGDCSNGACFWFTNNIEIVGEPTLPHYARSVQLNVTGGVADVYKTSPWRKPGSAKVFGHGCGVAGGGPVAYANGGTAPKGTTQGQDMLTMPPKTPATWTRGSQAEVAFAIAANHGGGYTWRLCKNVEGAVTEECFQNGSLKFASNSSWVAYPDGRRVAFPRVTVTEGVTPAHSEWARNPIPGCYMCDAYTTCGAPLAPVPMGKGGGGKGGKNMTCWEECPTVNEAAFKKAGCTYPFSYKSESKACLTAFMKTCCPTCGGCGGKGGGGKDAKWDAQVNCDAQCDGAAASKATGSCPAGTAQFPEAVPGISGFGKSIWSWSIMDKVEVPSDLEPGAYLLSWRWDCEESTQVWQNCADIKVV